MTSTVWPASCPHCGSFSVHIGMCPKIKAIEYHPNGAVKRVEYQDALGEQEAPTEPPPECPSGCGCRWLNEPDRRECACDGPCCTDEGWNTLPDGSPRPDESWDDDLPAAPQAAPEPERCPRCRSPWRGPNTWTEFTCRDPWHRATDTEGVA